MRKNDIDKKRKAAVCLLVGILSLASAFLPGEAYETILQTESADGVYQADEIIIEENEEESDMLSSTEELWLPEDSQEITIESVEQTADPELEQYSDSGNPETSTVDDMAEGAISCLENLYGEKDYAYGSEWVIYALLRSGRDIPAEKLESYYNKIEAKVSEWNENCKPTDMERVALTLTAMKRDITNVGGIDLASMICNSPRLDEGSNELAFALLALDAADIDIPADAKWNRGKMISALLAFQCESGAFGLESNQYSEGVDMTAMVVQSLANYRNRPQVESALQKAVDFLRREKDSDYGYGNAESTAQVLLALSVLGIDPVAEEQGFGTENWNMLRNLSEYQRGDGGFSHSPGGSASSEMPTVQVLEALEAYRMAQNDKGSYWNINGIRKTVTVTVLGDTAHGEDLNGQCHTRKGENLEPWLTGAEYRTEGENLLIFLKRVLANSDITLEENSDGAIVSVTRDGVTLKNGENGERSCWCCLKNDVLPEASLAWQELKDGDEILLHYTDDSQMEKTEIPEEEVTQTEAAEMEIHSFSEWTTVREATVFAPELQSRSCTLCRLTETREVGEILIPTVTVNVKSIPLKTGQQTGKVKVTGLAPGDSVVSWRSGNTKVVRVTKKGVIKAQKKTGKAFITITLASGKTARFGVIVRNQPVKTTQIIGIKKKLKLDKGSRLLLKPELVPVTSQDKAVYTSSDPGVVSVSKKGMLTARKKGTALITVKAGNVKAKCKVTVK